MRTIEIEELHIQTPLSKLKYELYVDNIKMVVDLLKDDFLGILHFGLPKSLAGMIIITWSKDLNSTYDEITIDDS